MMECMGLTWNVGIWKMWDPSYLLMLEMQLSELSAQRLRLILSIFVDVFFFFLSHRQGASSSILVWTYCSFPSLPNHILPSFCPSYQQCKHWRFWEASPSAVGSKAEKVIEKFWCKSVQSIYMANIMEFHNKGENIIWANLWIRVLLLDFSFLLSLWMGFPKWSALVSSYADWPEAQLFDIFLSYLPPSSTGVLSSGKAHLFPATNDGSASGRFSLLWRYSVLPFCADSCFRCI